MESDLELTLEEWLSQEREIMDCFAADWRKRNEIDPPRWPIKMQAGEWDEQFMIYHHGDGDMDTAG